MSKPPRAVMSSPIFSVGQLLRGKLRPYTISRCLQDGVFLATYCRAGQDKTQNAIIKSVRGHWRLRNERDILLRHQSKCPMLRPLIDEIVEPLEPPAIVLRYLDADLLRESAARRLSRPEIKTVAKHVLGALKILHEDGLVHTDIKLDNILVNHGQGQKRFSDIVLADCGGTVSVGSKYAKEGHTIGAAYARSPEVNLCLPWGTATDIWSFGSMILALLHGGNFHLFNPGNEGVKPDDNEYELTVLKRQHKFFGPFPVSYSDIADSDAIQMMIWAMEEVGADQKPFSMVAKKEVPPADKVFLTKIMKLDPRDRPTAAALLEDEWFSETSEDTREPLRPGKI